MQLAMVKVQIIGSQRYLDQVVRVLHYLGAIQIEDLPRGSPLYTLQPVVLDEAGLRRKEALTFLLTRIQALLALLVPRIKDRPDRSSVSLTTLYDTLYTQPTDDLLTHIKTQLDKLAPEVQATALRRDQLETERVSLPRYEATLRRLVPLAAELPHLEGFETAALLIERRFSPVLDLIRYEVDQLTGSRFEMVVRDVDEETTAALLVFPRRHSGAVQSLLGRENISQVRLPDELTRVPFKDALQAVARRQAAITAELAELDNRLQAFALEWVEPLTAWRAVLRDRLQESEVLGRLGATQYTFVLTGWMPRRSLALVRETLRREVGDQVMMEEMTVSPAEREHAPVALENPAPLKPFEFLVRLLALPRYGALDPTPLMALFLPIFFGLILGDIAYGALVVLLGWYLSRKYPHREGLRSLGQVFIVCGVWSVIMGVLYGEFLGTLGEHLGLHPLWLNRADPGVFQALFGFTIAVGVMQVVLGLILGAWETLRERRLKELGAKLGLLLALCAVFSMIGSAANLLPRAFFTPAVVALLIGVILVSYPLGIVGLLLGPLEVLGIVGNILSYLRIAAIGLSSVYLAKLANDLAGLTGSVVLGVIVAGLLHGLNLALGILSPTIQSLRLHYVEFFSKFFEPGGRSFTPFRRLGLSEEG